MLKSKVDVSEVLQALASSNSAMTADEVAKQVGVLRPFVNPMLLKMANSGQVIKIHATDDQPMRFQLIQGGLADKPPMNEPVDTANEQEAALAKAKSDADSKRPTRARSPAKSKAPAKEQLAKKDGDKPKAATKTQPDLQIVPQVAKTEPASSASQPSNSGQAEPIFTEMEMRVLNELRTGAKTEVVMLDTLRNMRNAEQVLSDLRENNVIASDFIIDERTYMLTEKGYEMLNQHDELQANAVLSEPSSLVETLPANEIGQLQIEVPAAPAALEEQVSVAPEAGKETTSPIREEVKHEASKSTAPAVSAGDMTAPLAAGSDEMMQRLSALLEDIVTERMGSVEQQHRRDSAERKKMAANINKATSALQIAIEALNEVSKQLSLD